MYTFEAYEYSTASTCTGVSYNIGGDYDSSFMYLNTGGTNPTLTVSMSLSSIDALTSFNLEFQVIDIDSGDTILNEPFVLNIADCRTVTGSNLAFENDPDLLTTYPSISSIPTNGFALIDATGYPDDRYELNLNTAMTYTFYLEPIRHEDAICGTPTITVTADDADYVNYGTYDSVNGLIVLDYNLRST